MGVANGTDAIEAILRGLGIGPGDEVVLPANTFIATAGAVHRAGARPVLVDCDDDCLLIDPQLIGPALTDRTRAVIGVDLYGQRAAFDDIRVAVAGSDVAIVEDAAQAQGARRHGRRDRHRRDARQPRASTRARTSGRTATPAPCSRWTVRSPRTSGRSPTTAATAKYEHRVPGMNSRLDALQAVVLRAKLRRLEGWNAMRRSAADRYDELLEGHDGAPDGTRRGNVHVWHLYVVRVADRDRRDRPAPRGVGIEAGIHYPAPIHLTPAYEWLGYRPGDLPVSEAASRSMISLPMHPAPDRRRPGSASSNCCSR